MKKTLYTIIALILVASISKAQLIPNGGFENWTSMGTYNNPDGWDQLNSTTSAMSVYTCEKGTPGTVGTSYLKLTSKTITGGVAPGIAVSGVINTSTFQPQSGFAFTNRPANLTGKWQHMIFGSSQGFVDVKLTRWDTGMNMRMTVASAHYTLTGMAMSWANFSIPLTYGTDSNNPDTCIIVLSASGTTPTNQDYLWVDALAFAGTQGVSENYFDANITVYPNPTSENLILDLAALNNQKVSLQVMDMQGKQVKKVEGVTTSSKTMLDISNLSKGNYMLNVISKEGTITRKFIKE